MKTFSTHRYYKKVCTKYTMEKAKYLSYLLILIHSLNILYFHSSINCLLSILHVVFVSQMQSRDIITESSNRVSIIHLEYNTNI